MRGCGEPKSNSSKKTGGLGVAWTSALLDRAGALKGLPYLGSISFERVMPLRGGKEHSLLSRHKDLGLSASHERKQDTTCEHQKTEARGFPVPV